MRQLQSLMGGLIVMTVVLGAIGQAQAARYVPVKIILDGKVLLEGNSSDDGHRDADQVWDSLKLVQFKPTDEFHKLNIAKDAQEALIKSTSSSGDLVNLKIEMAYGGVAVTHQLHLKRIPVDKFGREWQLDAKEVADLFESRAISRGQASQLANPKRTK